jgi:glycosyltransferase involved in cell wall biosynthesis
MLDTWANRLATHLIAVSHSCREFLIHSEGVAPERITLVQNAIDLGRFSPGSVSRATARGLLGIPENVPLVAGIGRLNPQKIFSLFLRVAAAIRRARPDVRFLIAGNGPEEQSLRGEADALGLRDAVVFSGYLADVRHVYLAADVLLMPSRFEGLPMTLLEAMAMEVPVVASNVDGMAEVLADGEDGFLVPSDAEEGFVRRTLTLLADRDLGRRLGRNARKKVEAQFSAGRMTAQVEAVYERFLP